jgi:hypothetical protein
MQPYFVPYAGYFRLFAATDLFVVYDCVQFPRRGWVHRNQLPDANGKPNWLTLPLAQAAQDVLIRDLAFCDGAAEILAERLRRFAIPSEIHPHFAPLWADLHDLGGSPVDYLVRLLERIVGMLGLPWRVLRSSSLHVEHEFRGQERILEIIRRLGATRYVNAPGGRALYEAESFAANGVDLRFLSDYAGSLWSILWRLAMENAAAIGDEIRAATSYAA